MTPGRGAWVPRRPLALLAVAVALGAAAAPAAAAARGASRELTQVGCVSTCACAFPPACTRQDLLCLDGFFFVLCLDGFFQPAVV